MQRFVVVFLVGLFISPAMALASIEIKWKVANPFRLFLDQADTDAHRAAYTAWLALPASERDRLGLEGKGPIYFAEIAYFAARHGEIEYLRKLKQKPAEPYRGWAEALIGPDRNKTCFDQTTQRYSACEKGAARGTEFIGRSYVNPVFHKVEIRLEGSDILPSQCIWSWVDNKTGARTEMPAVPCANPWDLDVPYTDGARISVRGAEAASRLAPDLDLKVTDILVVGLGDSFASGEGNPDSPVRLAGNFYNNYEEYRPTYEGDARDWCLSLAQGRFSIASKDCENKERRLLPLQGYPTRVGADTNYGSGNFQTKRHYFDRPIFRKQSSSWLSTACHRSLYSYQVRVALQLALEDAHRAVTFLGYACSGAELLQGLLLAEKFALEKEDDLSKRFKISQLSAVAQDLCMGHNAPKRVRLATALGSTYTAKLFDPNNTTAAEKFGKEKEATALLCEAKEKRKVDLVLVSFGGNDVGFVPLLGHIIAGHDKFVQLWNKKIKAIHDETKARDRLDMLGRRFAAADKAIENFLHIPQSERDRILVTAYPPMSYDENRKACGGGFFLSNDDEDIGWEKRKLTAVAAGMDVHPLFLFDASKAVKVQSFTASASDDGLYGRTKNTASRLGWTLVDSYLEPFRSHGICARAGTTSTDEQRIAELARLPRCRRGKNGRCSSTEWLPYDPTLFSPYVSRQRWIRTFNDAYLADHFHTQPREKINGKASWRLIASAAYSGAFHPTAEGQSVVADAVLRQARCVLLKRGAVTAAGRAQRALYAHCG